MVKASSHRNLSRDDAPLTPEHGARVLFGRVSELVSALADSAMPRAREFVRLETALEPCDLLQWLRGAPAGARRYFRDRSAKFEVAGIGIAAADQFGAHESWEQREGSSATASTWFVALPFDPARARDPQWGAFVDSECVLPLIELRRSGETHQLAVNITASTDVVALLELLERVANPDKSCIVEPALVRENDGTGEAEWTRAVCAGLTRIREGSLRKIVLARTRRYSASAPLDPVAVLMRLAARETRGFRFLLETAPRCAFLGVTPERLVSRTDRTVRSEAVAGTRPRGVDGVADRLLGESLLASAKDRREHELVMHSPRAHSRCGLMRNRDFSAWPMCSISPRAYTQKCRRERATQIWLRFCIPRPPLPAHLSRAQWKRCASSSRLTAVSTLAPSVLSRVMARRSPLRFAPRALMAMCSRRLLVRASSKDPIPPKSGAKQDTSCSCLSDSLTEHTTRSQSHSQSHLSYARRAQHQPRVDHARR